MKYPADHSVQARDLDAFTRHVPTAEQAERQEGNRKAALGLVALLRQNCPPSAELEKAVGHVRLAVNLANDAILIHERAPGPVPVTGTPAAPAPDSPL